MHRIIRRALAGTAAAVALGGLGTVGHQAVTPEKADASILFVKVASTSQHAVRVCENYFGIGPCHNIKPGHWDHWPVVASIQVDRGCELFVHGERKAKRKNHDWWYNYWVNDAKATIRLSNCR